MRGGGPHGRIQSEDVVAAAAAAAAVDARPAAPAKAPVAAAPAIPEIVAPDFAKFGPVETQPLSRIQRISGPRLHASWVNVPHVTHCDEADVTDLDAFRKTLDDDGQGRQERALSRLAAAAADEGVGRGAEGFSDLQLRAGRPPRTR